MAHKFTKSLLMVELNGEIFGIKISAEAFEQALLVIAQASPSGSLELSPMPNQSAFAAVMQKSPTC